MLLKSSSELSESEWGRGQRSKDGNKGIRTKNDYTQISFLGGCLTVCLSCTSLRWNHQEKWKLVFSFIWALSLNPEAPSLQSHLSPAESKQLPLPMVSPGCEHLETHSKALMEAKPTFCTHYLIIFFHLQMTDQRFCSLMLTLERRPSRSPWLSPTRSITSQCHKPQGHWWMCLMPGQEQVSTSENRFFFSGEEKAITKLILCSCICILILLSESGEKSI